MEATDRQVGRGLEADDGAQVTVREGTFERNRQVGVSAFGVGTRILLEHVLVRGTLEVECGADTCVGSGAGTGVGVYGGAYVNEPHEGGAASSLRAGPCRAP